jgi:hypothetical protein
VRADGTDVEGHAARRLANGVAGLRLRPIRPLQSAASTLGGDCQQSSCSNIWSAATPQADAVANAIFAAYMKKNNPTVPSLPPAEACPVPPAPARARRERRTTATYVARSQPCGQSS